MLIDVHTHVNFKAFESDGHETIRRALAGGVGMILVGSQNTTSRRSVDYANKYPQEPVYAAIGLHPIHLEDMHIDDKELGQKGMGFKTRAEKFDYDYYKKLAQDKKVVAIGEVGLDYYRTESAEARNKQQEVFRKQIELALETKKALMVHCRKAHEDCIGILREYFSLNPLSPERRVLRRQSPSVLNPLVGDIHFFEGTLEQAHAYFELGFTVSFTGVITFPPSASLRRAGKNTTHHQDLVKSIPLERIMLETDAPYITPEPHRGKRNEPLYVKLVAKKVAELKGISVEEVEKVTTKTARKVFQLTI
jgi:TatD DNase family protein